MVKSNQYAVGSTIQASHGMWTILGTPEYIRSDADGDSLFRATALYEGELRPQRSWDSSISESGGNLSWKIFLAFTGVGQVVCRVEIFPWVVSAG